MILHPKAREFYVLQITTEPQIAPWSASFDGEVTWTVGELVPTTTDVFRWLVAGPDFDPSGQEVAPYASLPLGKTIPSVRASDNPEVLYHKAKPGISVKA